MSEGATEAVGDPPSEGAPSLVSAGEALSWRARLGARLPPWLFWPLALLALSGTARAYRFRLALVEVPTFLLQDLAVGLAFGLGLFLVCRRGRPRDDLVLPLLGLAFLLWLALAGIVVTGLLALPVGAKLLLQAPSLIFLETALNAGSVQSSVSKLAAFALVGPLAALGGALWLRPGWGREPPRPRPWLALALIPLALSPWASFDARYRDTHPAVTLLSSALSLGLHQDPPDPGIPAELFRANVSDLGEGLAPIDSRLAALHWDGQSRYDVLVVVLETGVAPVLDLGRDITHEGRPWLPVLRRLARRSVWGQRHIAPFPGSTKSIFSLVASRYPYPDYRSLIRTRPEAPLETLPGRLAARGYRTGSYASIEGDYDRMDTFLSAHGFAELGDKESLGLTSLSNPTFGSDRDLYAAYQRWLVKSEDPSLFVLLPSNSHWPFYAPPEDTLFPGQDRLSRYKNALEHQDRLLGEHYAWLAAQGRLERTIVIVVADHGSYFDLAGAADDASPLGLLEHHVPLLIDHPRLRHGAGVVIPEATAHVDLGPTLLGMLSDQMPPADWQGLSLLEPRPVQRLVFFYQDFAEGRLAATDGRWVIAWNRERDVMSHAEWAGGPALLAPGQAGEERLRTFFAYQLTSLGRAR